MKAAIYNKYGPPETLHLVEKEKPVPKDNEALIRVHAATVTPADYRLRGFIVPLWFWLPARLYLGALGPKRKILGYELAGEVEQVGSQVTRLKKGDRIYGGSLSLFGAYAQFTCRPEEGEGALAKMPANLSYEQAATLTFGGITAIQYLRELGNIKSGDNVLVYGASGGVGTASVQMAKYFGARVTGVCGTSNLEMVKSLGADRVIDYTREDFTNTGETYDIIFDAVGKTAPLRLGRLLKDEGSYLLAVYTLWQLLQVLLISPASFKKLLSSANPETLDNLLFLNKVVESGNFKPVIDRTYPLEQIAEAHRYVEKGHKKGNVVITLEPAPAA